MPQTVWERVKMGSKSGFDKTWQALDKLGAPVNKFTNKLGSEAFWPTTLDKESDKAARILRSFCKDGFYQEEEIQPTVGPKTKQKVLQKIPERVIKNAHGLAIFTTMRTGLWMSGSGGSGVLVARLPDGSWSPPSGILMHTAGLGFMVGIDIYDCVVVINSARGMDAFTRVRCTLGAEISVAAGPVGAGGVLDTELHKRQAPIYTYLKSRGFYAGVQIDGTIVLERTDENERFYNQRIPVKDIMAGKVRHPPYELKMLMETLKAAQGDSNFDASMVPTEAPPGDYEIDHDDMFGVPDKDDPDPYGVLALEKEGMSLKEAGTSKRASWEQFQFHPSPTSPIHSVYARQSHDHARSMSRRTSWRASAFSNDPKTPSSLRNSLDRPPVLMTDMATQTDLSDAPLSPFRPSIRSVHSNHSSEGGLSNSHLAHMQEVPENEVMDTSPDGKEPASASSANGITTPPHTPPAIPEGQQGAAEGTDEDKEDAHVIEEPVVHSFEKAAPASAQVVSKARLVTVPKRLPPKLPPRNPNRSGPVVIDASSKDTIPSHDSSSDTGSHLAMSPPESEQEAVAETANGPSTVPLHAKLEDVKLDDEEDVSPISWAKIEETHQRDSLEANRMPGGFD